ncbi:MAG: hypothetical protein HQ503_13255 [Rhodospirillales bacterium]|nr:hypothetical protein [Rhodospirillales bacterium]
MAALILVACGELPKPFAHTGPGTQNPLLILDGSGGLNVSAGPNVPEVLTGPLVQATLVALTNAHIPAQAGGDRPNSYLLISNVTIDPGKSGQAETARLAWRLSDPRGRLLGEFSETITGDRAGWLTAQDAGLDIIAEAAVGRIAKFLAADAVTADKTAPISGPARVTFFIAGVDGAPGDGNASLAAALVRVIKNAGADIADSRDSATHLVNGLVRTGAAAAAPDANILLSIDWIVSTGDGAELGRVKQANQVLLPQISGRWGGLALVIAAGAGQGIFEILAGSNANSNVGKRLKIADQ